MLTDEDLAAAVAAYTEHGSQRAAALALGIAQSSLNGRLKRAAERGLMGPQKTLPGYAIASLTQKTADGSYVKQTKAPGEVFVMPEGLGLHGVTAFVDAEGRIKHQHIMGRKDARAQQLALEAAIAALKEDLPRIAPTPGPAHLNADLLNQYVICDSHFGALSWFEETGADYDLRIAEQLLLDWFSAAIAISPAAHTGVFAQLGDLAHHDSLESVTPAHRHVLDADSRLQKIIRVIIRVVRQIISMLLQKHQHVHIVMASGNHDPASSAWLREMLAAMYENEPRISVDSSPSLYYAYEWGRTALFYHHGHKRGIANVDAVFAGMFREMYGRCSKSYAHIGHLHSDEGKTTNLMKVERHETLAAPDAYAAGGGWLSGRSAKVITYSRNHGEVFRSTLSPEMVSGAAAPANDNTKMAVAA